MRLLGGTLDGPVLASVAAAAAVELCGVDGDTSSHLPGTMVGSLSQTLRCYRHLSNSGSNSGSAGSGLVCMTGVASLLPDMGCASGTVTPTTSPAAPSVLFGSPGEEACWRGVGECAALLQGHASRGREELHLSLGCTAGLGVGVGWWRWGGNFFFKSAHLNIP